MVISNKNKITKVLVCGSVDDGKSTLIGQLLYLTQSLPKSKLDEIKENENNFDYSSLLDGLQVEMTQSITVDVAHIPFKHNDRKYQLLDVPGHEEFTRNMITAASHADAAIILTDVSRGLTEQTYRHMQICSIMNISQLIICMNKMDLIEWDVDKQHTFLKEINRLSKLYHINNVVVLGISAKQGIGIIGNNSVLDNLEKFTPKQNNKLFNFLMPVQHITKENTSRYILGTISSGHIKLHDELTVFPTNTKFKVKEIIHNTKQVDSAQEDYTVAIRPDRDLNIATGYVLYREENKPYITNQIDTELFWLSDTAFDPSKTYVFMQHENNTYCNITCKYSLSTTFKKESPTLIKNSVGRCVIELSSHVAVTHYKDNKVFGSFIIVDGVSNEVVAGGVINKALELLTKPKAFVLWLSGRSGAGKTTLSNTLKNKIESIYGTTIQIDGDNIRESIYPELGYSKNDRMYNATFISKIADFISNQGVNVIVSSIAPIKEIRDEIEALLFEQGIFVYVHASEETCRERDPKGLYTSEHPPTLFEEPTKYYTVDTEQLSIEECCDKILNKINSSITQ